MPYLNLDLDYFTHPKTIRLIGLLGRGAAELPIRLWTYCGKYHCESGNLAGHSAEEIETVAGWWGTSGKMVEAMVVVGFLKKSKKNDVEYIINDWLDHAGHLSAFKKRAKTAAKKRWKKYATSIQQALLKHDSSNAPTLPTIPDQPQILFDESGLAITGSKDGRKARPKKPRAIPEAIKYDPLWVDLFWDAYPNKQWRPNVDAAFREINPDKELFDKIMAGLEVAKASDKWKKDGGEYIPHPAKFLKLRGWENKYSVSRVMAAGRIVV